MFIKILRKAKLGELVYKIASKILNNNDYMHIDVDTARQRLELLNEDKKVTCLIENGRDYGQDYDLAIIIPAYNVENFVVDCLNSVCTQVHDYKVQIIVVNDGSTDSTELLLKEYIDKHNGIKLISQENRGLSVARNIGLAHVNAKYVMFLDSDDMLTANSIECLLDCANEYDADCVEGAYELMSNDGIKRNKKSHQNGKCDAFTDFYGYPWGKIYKSEIFDNLQFPEGMIFEDAIIRQLIYPSLKKAYGISETVYCYRENLKGISHNSRTSLKAIDSLWVMENIHEDRKKLGIIADLEYYEYVLKMTVMTYRRVMQLEDIIKQDVFLECCSFIEKEFSGIHAENPKYKEVEKQLKSRNYKMFRLWCELSA